MLTLLFILIITSCLPEVKPGSWESGTSDSLPTDTDTGNDSADPGVDADGDGYNSDTDCDDYDSSTYPGATERCDGKDNDCDGSPGADEVDADGDGSLACNDCDDSDPAYHPGADESDCTDPNDYNCDGSTGYDDVDSDGYPACQDCDDSDSGVNPGASEVCDESNTDEDCDGAADDLDSEADGKTDWYADADGDGEGDSVTTMDACDQPSGYVSNDTDCDDSNVTINSKGTEVCDYADNDCDGSVDEGVTITFYLDYDGDGYGDSSTTTEDCAPPAGYIGNADDCDDRDSNAHPGATEICDGTDNDCDGDTDEADAADAATWFADSDTDGYGDLSSTTTACDQPTGYVSDYTDCDDTDSGVNPGASEVCGDGIDQDCDGSDDSAYTYYADADGDGYGDASDTTSDCSAPSGYVSDSTDCDDTDATVNPGATEDCGNMVDDDCDGDWDYADSADCPTSDGCVATGSNLVTDGGFDSGVSGFQVFRGSGVSIAYNSSGGYMEVTNTNKTGYWYDEAISDTGFSASSGTGYHVSFKSKLDSSETSLKFAYGIVVNCDNSKSADSLDSTRAYSSGWNSAEYTFSVTSSSMTSACIAVGVGEEFGSGDTLLLDNVVIRECV